MTNNSETLIDDGGIEISVSYGYDRENDYYEEQGNPGTIVYGMVYTELFKVEVIIKNRAVDILPLLHPEQKEWIIQQLQYD